jgi:hypothetical protein
MPKKSGYPEDAIASSKNNPQYLKTGDRMEFASGKKLNSEEPQCPEDARGPGYSNIAKGWVRGAPEGKAPNMNNETGMDYPGGNFDKSPSRDKMRR